MNKGVLIAICIGLFLMGVFTGFIGFQYYDGQKRENIENGKENESEKPKEIEVSLEDYRDLISNLTYSYSYASGPYLVYKNDKWQFRNADFSFKDLENTWFLDVALAHARLHTNDMDIGNDKLLCPTGTINKVGTDCKFVSDDIVKETMKTLFGKNFNYKNETTPYWVYKDIAISPESAGAYYADINVPNQDFAYYVENVPFKATKLDDKIYIYEAVGVREEVPKNSKDKLTLDYYEDKQSRPYDLKEVNLYNSLELKEKSKGDFLGKSPQETTQYVKEHPDEFSQYRYTFTQEGSHYIFTNIERVK